MEVLQAYTSGLAGQVTVTYGDILALDFPDNTFDRVVAEAVTMFVDRPRAVRELIRICKPGGRVLATEFFWRQPPTPEAREIFLGQVCPGMQVDTLEEWVRLYERAGLSNTQVVSGPFEMMTPAGFLSDEGVANCLAVMGRHDPSVLPPQDGLAHATLTARCALPRLPPRCR
jgi:SAM-dependent methyltransferase